MVRRPRHHAVVRRPVAQGGVRHLHGGQGAGRPRARRPTRGRPSTCGNKPSAYGVDRTEGTRPLWQALGNLDQAKSNYGAIVYNKAPAVLKQLEYLVGDDAFQRGRAGVPPAHAYANAGVARPARRGRRGGGPPARRVRPGLHAAAGDAGGRAAARVRDGRIARLALAQRPARRACQGLRPWTERTEVLLATPTGRRCGSRWSCATASPSSSRPWAAGARFRLRQRARLRVLPAAPRLAPASPRWSGARSQRADDAFFARDAVGRAVGSGARATGCRPERFVRLVAAGAATRDGRADRARAPRPARPRGGGVPPARKRGGVSSPRWSGCCGAARTTRRCPTACARRTATRFIALAGSPSGVLAAGLAARRRSVAGEPLRDPTRWDAVTRLLELGAADRRAAPG